MIVVNKKFKVIVITLLILLEVVSTYLMYRSFNNRNVVLDNVKLKGTNKNNGLAIMIEQEDGTYKESSSNAWPEEMMYNEDKSGCIDKDGNTIDGALTYEGGVATIKSNKTSYCYLYFDLIKDDITIAITTDGESGVMPSSTKYTNSATCSGGSISWNQKYQRIEIDSFGNSPSECNITFTKDTSSKTLLINEVESKATKITSRDTYGNIDISYRYTGKQPDNYVWFNNEMWRIIGSIPVCLEASCETNTTNLVKIIRKEGLSELVYDTKPSGSRTGAWGSNSLYNLLNEYYYGKLSASNTDYCYVAGGIRGVCDYSVIGINPNGYYGKMIKNVYWNTGASDVNFIISEVYFSEITNRKVNGYIGLINASDYGYSLSTSFHNNKMNSLNVSGNDSWLSDSVDDITITQNKTYAANYNYIHTNGNLTNQNSGNNNFVRPVVHLDSSVFIIEGTGSITNPYIIGM